MKCRKHHECRRTVERSAVLPERLVRAAVLAALRVTPQGVSADRLVMPGDSKTPADDVMLDELGRQDRQFPSVGVPPGFDEPCDKGSQHVIWYAC
jgi:hypothetical protein